VFIQVIQGKVADAGVYRRALDRWRTEVKPGARGYLGMTGGITADGRSIALVRFESEEAARANSERPEQGAWWNEMSKAFDGQPEFHDCREVDTMFGGGTNDAGFVQVMQGRAKDEASMRSRVSEIEPQLRQARPDLLGAVTAWHGDGGGFTQAAYFANEEAARQGEQSAENDPLMAEFMSLLAGEMTFWDLTEPELD
jgi:hypothetical protein